MCKKWKQSIPIKKRNTSYIIDEEVQYFEKKKKNSTQWTIRLLLNADFPLRYLKHS